MKKIILLFIIFLSGLKVQAQPGPNGTDVFACFKDEQGKTITADNDKFDIKWITWRSELINSYKWGLIRDTLSYKTDTLNNDVELWGKETIHIKTDSIFIVNVVKTPMGGTIIEGSHFLLVKNKTDTMRLYIPRGCSTLDDIRFRKGNYMIPQLTYIFHNSLKKEKRKLFRPNLYDDWDLFRIENQTPVYKKIYAECVQLFDNHHTATSLLSLLSPYLGFDKYFTNKYFDKPVYPAQFMSGGIYHIDEKKRNEYYHSFFGVFTSGIFIYQKDESSPYEYGYIEVPIDTTNVSRIDYSGNERFTQGFYNMAAMSHILSIDGNNRTDTGEYDMLGYYPGIRLHDESFGTVKPMWGFYKIHLSSLSEKEYKRIALKHAEQNNLPHDKEAIEEYMRVWGSVSE